MSRTKAVTLGVLLGCGCGGGGSGDAADAAPDPDAGDVWQHCVPDDVRQEAHLDVSGQVLDFAADDPVDGATVDFTTAWDTPDVVPADDCPLIDSFTTDGGGAFGPAMVDIGSQRTPPIVYFMVSGAGRAPTSSDQTAFCDGSGTCSDLGHTIRTPTTAVADAWRAALADGGVLGADERGLVIFEFREQGGAPAADVAPMMADVDLVPGTEVRFLEEDRLTLAPEGTSSTTASGLAIIAPSVSGVAVDIAGRRGDSDLWAPTGVLVVPGWIFLEDKQRTP